MRMRSGVAAIAALLVVASPVAAQPGAPPVPTPAPMPVPDQPPPDVTVTVDPARATYDQAMAALLTNDLTSAEVGFSNAARTAIDPELRGAARAMATFVAELSSRRGRLVLGPEPTLTGDTSRDDADEGRAGVIVTTTIASIYAGVVLSDLADTGDARAITSIIVGTTGLGFAASLYGTKGRTIYGGTSEAYFLGLMLGGANGLLLADPAGAETSEEWNVTVLGSAALVSAAGFFYGQTERPTRGQVSFAGTMATMGIATVGLGLAIVQPDVDSGDGLLLALAGGLDAGAAGGLVLGRKLDWAPGRARLVWLSALLGGLTGLAGAVLLYGDPDDSDNDNNDVRIAAGMILGGAWGGLYLGSHFTRNMRPDARYRVAPGIVDNIVPIAVPHGGGIGYATTW